MNSSPSSNLLIRLRTLNTMLWNADCGSIKLTMLITAVNSSFTAFSRACRSATILARFAPIQSIIFI